MADTSHIGPIPDKAYTADGSGETHVKSLQSMTETSVRQAIRGPVDEAFGFSRNSLLEQIVGGIGQAISNGLNGIFGGIFGAVGQAMKPVRDGQQDLEGRTDLLSPLLDYGSGYVNPNNRVHGTGWAVFSERIGPMRGCEMITDTQGGIRLLDKGLWDIRLHITSDQFFSLPGQTKAFDVQLLVYSPDGAIYASQGAMVYGESATTQTIVSSVMVPDSGYQVRVYVTKMFSGRGILGGPKWSRLTVQHISRDVAGDTGGENSNEPSN